MNADEAEAVIHRIDVAEDRLIQIAKTIERFNADTVTTIQHLEAGITQRMKNSTENTDACATRIATAIDRLTASIPAAIAAEHQKVTKTEARTIAEQIEAMCTGKGSLTAAPSQTRALLLGAASILRRC